MLEKIRKTKKPETRKNKIENPFDIEEAIRKDQEDDGNEELDEEKEINDAREDLKKKVIEKVKDIHINKDIHETLKE